MGTYMICGILSHSESWQHYWDPKSTSREKADAAAEEAM